MNKKLLGKFCKVVEKNGFVLFGFVVDINDFGIFLETDQKTSFISFTKIEEIIPKKVEDQAKKDFQDWLGSRGDNVD